MKNRISKDELLALTPDTWEAWYDAQSIELRANIMRAVDALEARGLNVREACVTVYAIVETAKLDELDHMMNLPHSVN